MHVLLVWLAFSGPMGMEGVSSPTVVKWYSSEATCRVAGEAFLEKAGEDAHYACVPGA